METMVFPEVSLFAVLDQRFESSTDRLIVSVCRDMDSAERYVRNRLETKETADRLWRIAEFPVCPALVLPMKCEMLYVVYEEDASGIRPLNWYASELLARYRVQTLASAEHVRLFTDELTGAVSQPCSYWWECCPWLSLNSHKGGLYVDTSLIAA